MSNIYYPTQVYYEGPGTSPSVKTFIAAYQKAYGHFPESVNCLIGNQVMTLVLDAVKAAGTLNAAAISKALYAQHNKTVAGATLINWTKGYGVWAPRSSV